MGVKFLTDDWAKALTEACNANTKFTKEILAKPNIDRLQDFSDEEQRRVLSAVANYDFEGFRNSLKALKQTCH